MNINKINNLIKHHRRNMCDENRLFKIKKVLVRVRFYQLKLRGILIIEYIDI